MNKIDFNKKALIVTVVCLVLILILVIIIFALENKTPSDNCHGDTCTLGIRFLKRILFKIF